MAGNVSSSKIYRCSCLIDEGRINWNRPMRLLCSQIRWVLRLILKLILELILGLILEILRPF